MKQINIYFGKQEISILGDCADIVKVQPADEDIENVVKNLTDKGSNWTVINLPNGKKYINLKNVLWFDIVDIEE